MKIDEDEPLAEEARDKKDENEARGPLIGMAVTRVERVLPRLMDEFNLFLSQLRPEDMRGASGLHRVREGLADRASALVQPSQVSAILFREIMIQ